jgi:hypothetical protein
MTVAELRALMDDPVFVAGKDYLVVDVRRTDMDVGRVPLRHRTSAHGALGSTYQHGSSCRDQSPSANIPPDPTRYLHSPASVSLQPSWKGLVGSFG